MAQLVINWKLQAVGIHPTRISLPPSCMAWIGWRKQEFDLVRCQNLAYMCLHEDHLSLQCILSLNSDHSSPRSVPHHKFRI